jgi:tol-pal system protein YbgF
MRRIAGSRSSTGAEAMRTPLFRAAAATIAALASAGAHAQSKGERIEVLEGRMEVVERKLDNQALVEMSRQLTTLEAEVRRLRGEVERLQHELERARTQQKDQYVDLDARLKAVETAAVPAPAGTVPPVSPEAEYQAAINLLRDGQYDPAAAALRDFLAKHKDHDLASNALYWLGEAHYVRRDYPAALAAFEGVLRDYPGARKSPDALLKAGYCQQELKRYDSARATLARVMRDYPDSSAAAEAEARLKRLAEAQ